jgi:hypothetical protein
LILRGNFDTVQKLERRRQEREVCILIVSEREKLKFSRISVMKAIFERLRQVLKRLFVIVLISSIASTAKGVVLPENVSTRVVFRDSNIPVKPIDPCIPHVYRPIVVGANLAIIVSSDVNGYWNGGLSIKDPYRDYGVLFGRDYNYDTLDWKGSRFEAAGEEAIVWDFQEDIMSGFDMYGDEAAIPGDWFIIDYNATNVGWGNIGFYDYAAGGKEEPIYNMSFTQVLTPDFNDDGSVDFMDFAILGLNWQRTDCISPEYCSGTDLNEDGVVDYADLKSFAYFWLESPG